MTRAITLIPLLLLAACAADTVISLQTYSKTCATEKDCVPIRSGEICGACDCPNDAINSAELARFNAEFKDKEQSCSQQPVICPCVPRLAACKQGQCMIQ